MFRQNIEQILVIHTHFTTVLLVGSVFMQPKQTQPVLRFVCMSATRPLPCNLSAIYKRNVLLNQINGLKKQKTVMLRSGKTQNICVHACSEVLTLYIKCFSNLMKCCDTVRRTLVQRALYNMYLFKLNWC